MSSFPGSPRLLQGGLVLVDPGAGSVRSIIALQDNLDTTTRLVQIHGVMRSGGESSLRERRYHGSAGHG